MNFDSISIHNFTYYIHEKAEIFIDFFYILICIRVWFSVDINDINYKHDRVSSTSLYFNRVQKGFNTYKTYNLYNVYKV